MYSRAFFKEYFFESVLELANDSVPNVRLKLCPLLPKLKQLVKLPADRNLLQLLEQAVRKILVNETDRDVTAAIESAVKLLDEVQVPMDSVGVSIKMLVIMTFRVTGFDWAVYCQATTKYYFK